MPHQQRGHDKLVCVLWNVVDRADGPECEGPARCRPLQLVLMSGDDGEDQPEQRDEIDNTQVKAKRSKLKRS
jgi:hypothetical protein